MTRIEKAGRMRGKRNENKLAVGQIKDIVTVNRNAYAGYIRYKAGALTRENRPV